MDTRQYNTAGQLTSSEFATFAPDSTGRIGSVSQKLVRANGSGGWVSEDVPFNALYNSLGQLTSFTAVCASPVFQWGHTYSYGPNGNRTSGTITANGASMGFTNGMQPGTNRQSTAAGVTVTTNAAGDITSLLGKALTYDSGGRLSEATAVPPCPTGSKSSNTATRMTALLQTLQRPHRVAKSRSPWPEGVARHLVRPISAEWPLLKVQRSVASQDPDWQVSAATASGCKT